jgi:hypothetical protein
MPNPTNLPLWRHRAFRIFYTSFYTLLIIALLGLILITPGDAIRQALFNKQIYNVFVIAGTYIVTAVTALLIFASRIYTTRSVLAAIPKSYVPIEEGDVKRRVRRMIGRGLSRSAVVALRSRPRMPEGLPEDNYMNGQLVNAATAESVVQSLSSKHDVGEDVGLRKHKRGKSWKIAEKLLHKRRKTVAASEAAALMPTEEPVWGPIAHPGWSSPLSPDLPHLHFTPVILELPNLLEAKVVATTGTSPEALLLMARGVNEGIREYLLRLRTLGVLAEDFDHRTFNRSYEMARYGGAPLTESAFRALMQSFASLLRAIQPLDPYIAAQELGLDPSVVAESMSLADENEVSGYDASSMTSATESQGSVGTARKLALERDMDRRSAPPSLQDFAQSRSSLDSFRTGRSQLSGSDSGASVANHASVTRNPMAANIAQHDFASYDNEIDRPAPVRKVTGGMLAGSRRSSGSLATSRLSSKVSRESLAQSLQSAGSVIRRPEAAPAPESVPQLLRRTSAENVTKPRAGFTSMAGYSR